MATELADGGAPLWWTVARDTETGHRDYKIRFRVFGAKGQNVADGPANVLNTPGLPLPGSVWNFDGDFDGQAFCKPGAVVTKELNDNKPTEFYIVEMDFSTRPGKRCWDVQIENPLFEPQEVEGNFQEFTREATHDRHGRPVMTSSHEMLRGPQNEWEESRGIVRVSQNVLTLQYPLLQAMNNTVNAYPLWGMPRRTIKLTVLPWKERFHAACFRYYTRSFEFRFSFEKDALGRPLGWDRVLLDEGTKFLNGHWDGATWVNDPIAGYTGTPNPDPSNPSHFIRAPGRDGNVLRMILDGRGNPYNPEAATATTACAACPNGAPTKWYLHVAVPDIPATSNPWLPFLMDEAEGLDATNPYVPWTVVELNHGGGCSWSGGTWTLSGSGTPANWVLSDSSTESVYNLAVPNPQFRCNGENTFLLTAGNGPGTAVIRPRASTVSRPGEIRVERYHESNFLALGIPALIGP